MLNMSAMRSMLKRSPKNNFLETRMSLKTVHGVMPALRPRLPSRDASVPLKSARQGSCKTPVGEYLLLKEVPQAGLAVVLGRLVREDNWRLSPPAVMMLNGRPEPNSMRGAKVQLLKSLPAKPLLASLPVS